MKKTLQTAIYNDSFPKADDVNVEINKELQDIYNLWHNEIFAQDLLSASKTKVEELGSETELAVRNEALLGYVLETLLLYKNYFEIENGDYMPSGHSAEGNINPPQSEQGHCGFPVVDSATNIPKTVVVNNKNTNLNGFLYESIENHLTRGINTIGNVLPFMRHFSEYVHKIAINQEQQTQSVKANSSLSDEEKESQLTSVKNKSKEYLTFFPAPTFAENQCLGGHETRLDVAMASISKQTMDIEAMNQTLEDVNTKITEAKDEKNYPLVYAGNQVHIVPALKKLIGFSQDKITDKSYQYAIDYLPITTAWDYIKDIDQTFDKILLENAVKKYVAELIDYKSPGMIEIEVEAILKQTSAEGKKAEMLKFVREDDRSLQIANKMIEFSKNLTPDMFLFDEIEREASNIINSNDEQNRKLSQKAENLMELKKDEDNEEIKEGITALARDIAKKNQNNIVDEILEKSEITEQKTSIHNFLTQHEAQKLINAKDQTKFNHHFDQINAKYGFDLSIHNFISFSAEETTKDYSKGLIRFKSDADIVEAVVESKIGDKKYISNYLPFTVNDAAHSSKIVNLFNGMDATNESKKAGLFALHFLSHKFRNHDENDKKNNENAKILFLAIMDRLNYDEIFQNIEPESEEEKYYVENLKKSILDRTKEYLCSYGLTIEDDERSLHQKVLQYHNSEPLKKLHTITKRYLLESFDEDFILEYLLKKDDEVTALVKNDAQDGHYDSFLIASIEVHNYDLTNALINAGANIEFMNLEKGENVLSTAVQFLNLRAVKSLIQNSVSLDKTYTNKLRNILHILSVVNPKPGEESENFTQIAQILVANVKEEQINQQDDEGLTPLFSAMINRRDHDFALLLLKDERLKIKVTSSKRQNVGSGNFVQNDIAITDNNQQNNIMHYTAQANFSDEFNTILFDKIRSKLEIFNVNNADGLTPLQLAVQSGSTSFVKKFIEEFNPDLTTQTIHGQTLLHLAALSDDEEIYRGLFCDLLNRMNVETIAIRSNKEADSMTALDIVAANVENKDKKSLLQELTLSCITENNQEKLNLIVNSITRYLEHAGDVDVKNLFTEILTAADETIQNHDISQEIKNKVEKLRQSLNPVQGQDNAMSDDDSIMNMDATPPNNIVTSPLAHPTPQQYAHDPFLTP